MGPDVIVPVAFFATVISLVIGIPIVRAKTRLMERSADRGLPSDVAQRLERMEQAIDAIAIEVERISEGQRFTTRLLSERVGESPSALPRPGDGGRSSPNRDA